MRRDNFHHKTLSRLRVVQAIRAIWCGRIGRCHTVSTWVLSYLRGRHTVACQSAISNQEGLAKPSLSLTIPAVAVPPALFALYIYPPAALIIPAFPLASCASSRTLAIVARLPIPILFLYILIIIGAHGTYPLQVLHIPYPWQEGQSIHISVIVSCLTVLIPPQ